MVEPEGLGQFVMYVGWLVALIVGVASIYFGMRRRNSAESEWATRGELYRVEGQLISKIDKVEGKTDANQSSNHEMFNTIMRSIGGVEQGIKDLRK